MSPIQYEKDKIIHLFRGILHVSVCVCVVFWGGLGLVFFPMCHYI